MGLSVEYSGLGITQLIYKTALILALVRWISRLTLKYMGLTLNHSDAADVTSNNPASLITPQMIRDNLHVSTYGDISESSQTCAVCLNELEERDEVPELRNCCHVFHRSCIDRWVEYDKTCPLCRAPLLVVTSCCVDSVGSETSWAVERLLYLFGDDLL